MHLQICHLLLFSLVCLCTLGARGFLKEEPRSGEEREGEKGEKTSGYPQQLTDLTAPIDLN